MGLFETRRPGSGKTSSGGYTYYRSDMSNGTHLREVILGIPGECGHLLKLMNSWMLVNIRHKLLNSKRMEEHVCDPY